MVEQFKLLIRHIFQRIDWLLLTPILLACGYGLVLISSATASFGSKKMLIVQLVGILAGIFMALVVLTLEHENLARFSAP
ncbi:MAG: hypothetical protein IJN34_06160, partial [Clostridia bacterium]|nr:hypothetical protein [Clostridia bacterium]